MRFTLLLLAIGVAQALQGQETPLTALPYTPVLDTRFMDKSVDPCTDFYKYACGNWNKLNPIPADQARWEVYSKLTEENQRFLMGHSRQGVATRHIPYCQRTEDRRLFLCLHE